MRGQDCCTKFVFVSLPFITWSEESLAFPVESLWTDKPQVIAQVERLGIFENHSSNPLAKTPQYVFCNFSVAFSAVLNSTIFAAVCNNQDHCFISTLRTYMYSVLFLFQQTHRAGKNNLNYKIRSKHAYVYFWDFFSQCSLQCHLNDRDLCQGT